MGSLRAFYGTAYLALGALLPVMALSLADRGLSPSQYALVLAVQPATRLWAPPLWGAIADRYLGGARLLRVNAFIAAAAMATYAMADTAELAVGALLVWSLVASSLFPLADAGTHAQLGSRASEFGRTRVFGSMGFLVAALLVGAVGMGERYAHPFAIAAIGYSLAGVSAGGFPARASFARPGIVAAVRGHLGGRDMRWLMAGAVFYYVGHGIYDAFLGPHVVRVAGIAPEGVSLLWALGVLVEIPVVYGMPRWLRLRPARDLLIVSAVTATLRWALLSQASEPWHVWALQPLHGITFGLWYLAFVHENQRRAPAELRATMQGLGSGALGLGMVCGTLSGGPLIEASGTQAAFVLASASAALACVCYVALPRRRSVEAQGGER